MFWKVKNATMPDRRVVTLVAKGRRDAVWLRRRFGGKIVGGGK